jgi:hypothetical protein
VKILSVQEFGLTVLQPLSPSKRLAFWTVAIRARVISIALMAALITLLKMTTQKSSATDLDCCHYAVLRV